MKGLVILSLHLAVVFGRQIRDSDGDVVIDYGAIDVETSRHPVPDARLPPGFRPGQRPVLPRPVDRTSQQAKDCREIASNLFEGMQYSLSIVPALTNTYQKYIGISGYNHCELEQLACSLIGAKTLQEVADKIPATLSQVKSFFETSLQGIIARGGYTGYFRYPSIRYDVGKWAKSNGFAFNRTKISEQVDLGTFTHFLESMQRKYGSRWVSALLDLPQENLLITDMKKFARDLYDSNTEEELRRRTGVDGSGVLLRSFGDQSVNPQMSWAREQGNLEVIRLMARNGFLDLQ